MLQQATEELDVATLGIFRVVFAALSVCPVMSLLGGGGRSVNFEQNLFEVSKRSPVQADPSEAMSGMFFDDRKKVL